jgi:hypothetical protein
MRKSGIQIIRQFLCLSVFAICGILPVDRSASDRHTGATFHQESRSLCEKSFVVKNLMEI